MKEMCTDNKPIAFVCYRIHHLLSRDSRSFSISYFQATTSDALNLNIMKYFPSTRAWINNEDDEKEQ